jgi:hypothetical protein
MLLNKKLTEYNRYQAFATHLVISLAIFFILLVCITQYWYPGILFDTGNGWKAIGIIIGVDLILGPLLTLIIFNPKKSSLKLDLSIVALIQVAALIYGTWTIHSSRPIALAFLYQNFSTIYANAPFANELEDVIKKGQRKLVYLSDTEQQSYKLDPKLFKSYTENADFVVKKIMSLQDDKNKKYYWVPISNLTGNNSTIKVNAKTGEILEFSDDSQ